MDATQKQTDNLKDVMRNERMFHRMMQHGAINKAEYQRIVRTQLLAAGVVSDDSAQEPQVVEPPLQQVLQALVCTVDAGLLRDGQEILWVDVTRIERHVGRAFRSLPDTRLLAVHLESAMPVLTRSGLELSRAEVKRVLREAQLVHPDLVVGRGIRLYFGSQSNRYRAHVLDWTQVLALASYKYSAAEDRTVLA